MGDVTYNYLQPEVRSGYLEQVRRIAPAELRGREKDLTRLASFCTDVDVESPYLWCRGSAWTGKTALLSSFVLHPPENVEIVAFFITGRLSGQDNRTAFTEVVLEQLLDILDQEMPAFMTEATKEAHLLRLLNEAAELMQDSNQRLILIVDGLDEDRSLISGSESHSIAGLLPKQLSFGMRAVVASRPDPPIPADVPHEHPLRNRQAVWDLNASLEAQTVKSEAFRDLKRLLRGTETERDLLGFVASSGGGLSGPDLASLTGCRPWEIEEYLHSVTGRSFMQRPSHWVAQDAAVYLFAHEELQVIAVDAIGEENLTAYRGQLNEWAESYRARGWPSSTPEYLLRGYYRMLLNISDAPRIVQLASDGPRHDRMLDASGSDLSAFTEIATALELLQAQDVPDLANIALLSMHRDYLANRNANIPTELPSVWVMINDFDRAEALARTISNPKIRDLALSAMVKELAKCGNIDHARRIASGIENRFVKDDSLVAVVAALISIDEIEQASNLACVIDIPVHHFDALEQVATAMASAGDHAHAIECAQLITAPARRVDALMSIAVAAWAAGDKGWSREIVDAAESIVGMLERPVHKVRALTSVSEGLMKCGYSVRAEELIRHVESMISDTGSPESRVSILLTVAQVYAGLGLVDDAERIAQTIPGVPWQIRALVGVASTLAAGPQCLRAKEICNSALSLTDQVTKSQTLAKSLVVVVRGMAAVGEVEKAWEIAQRISNSNQRNRAMGEVVAALAAANKLEQAISASCSVSNTSQRAQALTVISKQLARVGEVDRAVEQANLAQSLVSAIPAPKFQSSSAVVVVEALVTARQLDFAERVARGIESPSHREISLGVVAEALADFGKFQVAEEICAGISDPNRQAKVTAEIIRKLVVVGDKEKAVNLTESVLKYDGRGLSCVVAVEVLIAAGRFEAAEERARVASNQTNRAEALANVAHARALAGYHDHAKDLANEALGLISGPRRTARQSRVLARVALVWSEVGNSDKAKSIALSSANRRTKGRGLVELARFSAERGRSDFAVSVAEFFPAYRAEVLITIAQVWCNQGATGRAVSLVAGIDTKNLPARALAALSEVVQSSEGRRLLARSFNSGSWTISLRSLARVDPAALISFAEKMANERILD